MPYRERVNMVLIELKDECSKFLCTDCNRTIFTGQNFLVNQSDLPKNSVTMSDNGMYYTCFCGSTHELIRSSNPMSKELLKFKHVKVVEMGYVF